MDPFEIFEHGETPLAAALRERLGPETALAQILRGEDCPTIRALSFPELESRKGIPYSRQYVDRLERADKFPTRIQLGGGNSVAWLEHEVDEWLLSRPRGRLRDGRAERGKAALERRRK